MSAAPISAAEPDVPAPVRAALERAGWPVEAWLWEQAVVEALTALTCDDVAIARGRLNDAQALALHVLPAGDLRRVTAAAGLAMLDGDAATLGALAECWSAGKIWVDGLRPHRRARSSLFHLRLEAKHPGGYDQVQRTRNRALWVEGQARLSMEGATAGAASAVNALGRWRTAQGLTGFVDQRKLLAAATLLLG